MLWGADSRANACQEPWRGSPEFADNGVPMSHSCSGCGGSLANTRCNLDKACDRDAPPHEVCSAEGFGLRNLFPHEVIERDSRLMLDQAGGKTVPPVIGAMQLENRLQFDNRNLQDMRPTSWSDLNPGDVAATVALARSLEQHWRDTAAETEELRRMVLSVDQRAEGRVRQVETERHAYTDRIRAALEEVAQKLEQQEDQIQNKLSERLESLEMDVVEQRKALASLEGHVDRVEAAAAAAATAAAEGCARALEASTAELQKGIEDLRLQQDRKEIETLKVTVVSAEGLPNKDGWAGGLSDPYAVCRIVGQEGFRTPTIANSMSPSWNHTGHLANFSKADVLEIQVWDRNTLRQDVLIGTSQLSHSAVHSAGLGKHVDLPLFSGGEVTKSVVRVCIDSEAPAPSAEQAVLSSVDHLTNEMAHVQSQAIELSSRIDSVQHQMSGLRSGAPEDDEHKKQQALLSGLESRLWLVEAHLGVKQSFEDPLATREFATPSREIEYGSGSSGVIQSVQSKEDIPSPRLPLFGRAPNTTEGVALQSQSKGSDSTTTSAGGSAMVMVSTAPAPMGICSQGSSVTTQALAEKLPHRLVSSLAAQKEHIQFRARTLEKSMECLRDPLRSPQREESEDPPPRIVFDGHTGQVIEPPH